MKAAQIKSLGQLFFSYVKTPFSEFGKKIGKFEFSFSDFLVAGCVLLPFGFGYMAWKFYWEDREIEEKNRTRLQRGTQKALTNADETIKKVRERVNEIGGSFEERIVDKVPVLIRKAKQELKRGRDATSEEERQNSLDMLVKYEEELQEVLAFTFPENAGQFVEPEFLLHGAKRELESAKKEEKGYYDWHKIEKDTSPELDKKIQEIDKELSRVEKGYKERKRTYNEHLASILDSQEELRRIKKAHKELGLSPIKVPKEEVGKDCIHTSKEREDIEKKKETWFSRLSSMGYSFFSSFWSRS